MCVQRGLPKSGNKATLVARILEHERYVLLCSSLGVLVSIPFLAENEPMINASMCRAPAVHKRHQLWLQEVAAIEGK